MIAELGILLAMSLGVHEAPQAATVTLPAPAAPPAAETPTPLVGLRCTDPVSGHSFNYVGPPSPIEDNPRCVELQWNCTDGTTVFTYAGPVYQWVTQFCDWEVQ
jgi:hypothetical protein